MKKISLLFLFAACTPAAPVSPPAQAGPSIAVDSAIDAADRSAEDKALDAGRHPKELLTFAGITPGMKVGEIAAGGGYTTELLARAVGPSGHVYAQNSAFILQRFAEKPWAARLQKPVMVNVTRLDREFDDPFPPELKDLDAVFIVLFYHDLVWLKTNRSALLTSVKRALKPGGEFIVVDHSAAAGHGIGDSETLHRIEQTTLEKEVTDAGFKLTRSADFLKNLADPRDWNDSPRAAGERRGTSDRFVLAFTR